MKNKTIKFYNNNSKQLRNVFYSDDTNKIRDRKGNIIAKFVTDDDNLYTIVIKPNSYKIKEGVCYVIPDESKNITSDNGSIIGILQ